MRTVFRPFVLAVALAQAPALAPALAEEAPASRPKASPARQAVYARVFEAVFTKIRDHTPELAKAGLDWEKTGAEHRERACAAKSDEEFHAILGAMIGKIEKSHFVLIPPEGYLDDDAGPGGEADVGIRVKTVEGRPTIVRVRKKSPAAKVGLKKGTVLLGVDRHDCEEIARRVALRSRSDAMRAFLLAMTVQSRLAGPEGSKVRLRYLDGSNEPRETTLAREVPASQETTTFGELGAFEIRCEKRKLPGNIGYVSFNVFVPALLDRIREAILSFGEAKGLVLDLRGNPGGIGAVAPAIAALFTREKGTSLGTSIMSAGEIRFAVFPREDALDLPLVVLVDQETASTGEILAAGLQEAGRAIVVGTPSAGAVLLSLVERLETGARLQCAFGDFKTAKGRELEGVGVIPDVTVPLARSSLLQGKDNVLDAAVRLLQGARRE